MTTETLTIKGTRREHIGTKHTRRMRAAGQMPAVIYGHGEDPVAIALSARDVGVELQHGSHVVHVKLDDKQHQFLIKSVQYDYLGTTPIHLDLMRVDQDEKVMVIVGIELRGTPKGINQGGVLDQLMSAVEVECLMTTIPETFHPSVNDLDIGEFLLVKDIEFPTGVVPLADPEDRVAMVRMQVEEAEVGDEALEEGQTSQPEVIGRVKKDEGEEGSK